MNIKIILKSIAKTRAFEELDYQINDTTNNLRHLVEQLVNIEIDRYETECFKVSSQEELDNMLINGKVSFGFKYRESKVDRKQAVDVALQAFEDGLYVVFVNDQKIDTLNKPLNLKQNDKLVLVRLTMLTGRYY